MEDHSKDQEENCLLAPVTPLKFGCQSAQGSSEAKTGVVIQGSMINSADTNPAKFGCTGLQASSISAKTGAIKRSMMDSSDTNTAKLFANSRIDLGLPCHDDDLSRGVGARSGFGADNCGVGVGKVSELGKSSCLPPQEPCAETNASCARKSQSDFGREDFNFTPDSKQSQKQRGRKRKSTGIDLNKKPRQRVKTKVHRPKIFDASKPKKIPKEKIPQIPKDKKVRKKAKKSDKTPGLNSSTKPKPKSKKISKEKKVREKVSKSEKTAVLELDPKTPSPSTPEPLAPSAITPVLDPFDLEISLEGSNSENNTARKIGRFSDPGCSSVCRRSLNFNLEDPSMQDGGDGNVNEDVIGGIDNPIDVVNLTDLTDHKPDLDFNVGQRVDPRISSSDERSVREMIYTYNRRRWRRKGYGDGDGHVYVFDVLIAIALAGEEEDFESSIGMKTVLREYRFDALFKNFPQFLKRRRSKRQKRGLDFNLRMTFKLFNGHKVPTKKRSNTQRRYGTCRGLVLPSPPGIWKPWIQNLAVARSPLFQPPEAALNLPIAQTPLAQPPAINGLPLTFASAGGHIQSQPVSECNILSRVVSQQHPEAMSNPLVAPDSPTQPANQTYVIDDPGFHSLVMFSNNYSYPSVIYNLAHDQIQQYHSGAAEIHQLHHTPNMYSNYRIQQHKLGCDDDLFKLQVGLPQYRDVNLLTIMPQPSLQDNVTKNAIPHRGSDDATKSIDYIEQRLESLHIRDDYMQDQRQSTIRTLVAHKKKIKQPKQVPKVDLDEETLQVWDMLMNNGSREEDDGQKKRDEEKEKWWAKERGIFGKRVHSLIARMHGIQGNRRFSQWKGSVVDSVVGVFLTQNVSDNLSSSAFMALASRFPAPQSDKNHGGEDIALIQGSVVDEDIASSQESVGSSTIAMDACSQESTGSNVKIVRPDKKQSSHFDIELDINQVLEEKKEDSSVTASEDILLRCVKDDIEVTENSSSQEISSCGSSTSQGIGFGISKDKVALTTSLNSSSNHHQGGKEKTETMKSPNEENMMLDPAATRSKKKKKAKVTEKTDPVNWDELRQTYSTNRPRTMGTMDSVDWNRVSCATVEEISRIISDRGMHNIIAGRIKNFLDRMLKDHENIDLEWLRNVPPDKVKDYLLSIDGVGLKSVECVRLLTLQHHAFPVDTNVGRVAVRLGWVPLQPLPGNLEIDDLKQYPLVDSIQKYLWPRLCMLNQRTLYELHYQLITFGKVFCTKQQPNCYACPLKAECRHFASAFARGKLRLPVSQEKSIVTVNNPCTVNEEDPRSPVTFPLISLCNSLFATANCETKSCEPTVELPPSPEPENRRQADGDIEDLRCNYDDEISPIENDGEGEVLRLTLTRLHEETSKTESEILRALDTINPEASSPTPKLKIIGRLRTVHNAYELPDMHPLLQTFDKREVDDPCPYLLAICSPGDSTNAVGEKNSDEVSATILIPCRTAMRGSFPLNGTYFQVNEVFADDETSRCPIRISKSELQRFRRRALYCGTSATSIFKGLATNEIRYCFWQGFICVRAFNRRTRAPKPLPLRFRPPGGPAKNFKEEYEYDE